MPVFILLKAKNIPFYLYIWRQENQGKCSVGSDYLKYPQTARVMFWGKKDRGEECEFLDKIKRCCHVNLFGLNFCIFISL